MITPTMTPHRYLEQSVAAYAAHFNALDLVFRGVTSPGDFVAKYMASLRPPTAQEYQERLSQLLIEMRSIIKPYRRLASIPITIYIMTDPKLENGMPHTHANAIIIPEVAIPKLTVETLVHEQLHVFQKLYPLECHVFYTHTWGFSVHGLNNPDTRRSNPDNTAILYKDSTHKPFNNSYNTNASRITDIQDRRDHPNEVFAYRVAAELVASQVQDVQLRALLMGEPTIS